MQNYLKTGNGETTIKELDYNEDYQIRCECNETYTLDGVYITEDLYPSLFKSNPFIPEFPKMMEVSDDRNIWREEKVYAIDMSLYRPVVLYCNYALLAREIQEKPKLSEILKEKGIDISQFENDL